VLEADRLLARHGEHLPHPVSEIVVHFRPFISGESSSPTR
jgi:hypothetical protein